MSVLLQRSIPAMRVLAISCLLAVLALLAWRPGAPEEEGRYVLVNGAELCSKAGSKPGPAEGPSVTGLIRLTCDLDGALLSLQNYYRDNSVGAAVVDPGDKLPGRLRATRRKPSRLWEIRERSGATQPLSRQLPGERVPLRGAYLPELIADHAVRLDWQPAFQQPQQAAITEPPL